MKTTITTVAVLLLLVTMLVAPGCGGDEAVIPEMEPATESAPTGEEPELEEEGP